MRAGDLVAFRVMRRTVRVKPGDNVNHKVWDAIRNDDGGIKGVAAEMTSLESYYGLCWKFNPHELASVRKFYDIEGRQVYNYGAIAIWIYALMPRHRAICLKLSGRRAKGLCYDPLTFLDTKKIGEPCN